MKELETANCKAGGAETDSMFRNQKAGHVRYFADFIEYNWFKLNSIGLIGRLSNTKSEEDCRSKHA